MISVKDIYQDKLKHNTKNQKLSWQNLPAIEDNELDEQHFFISTMDPSRKQQTNI
jgi:hypothetical protein